MLLAMLKTIEDFLVLGGPVVVLLALTSIIAFALVMLKLAQFLGTGVGATTRAQRALASFLSGNIKQAQEIAQAGRGTTAACMAIAIGLTRDGQFSKAEIEDEVERAARIRLHGLENGLNFLEAIAQLSPLLGLFGTVIGMIEAFQKLQGAGNAVDPSILAGGIWVALLTTAAGLAVAMPVSLVLTFLEARLAKERMAIESFTGALLSPVRSIMAKEEPVPTTPPLAMRHAV